MNRVTHLVIVLIFVIGCGQDISDTKATQIARKESRMNIPADNRVIIERDDNTVTVIFPTNWAPGVRGPDYYAKVTLDRKTGKVLNAVVGS